ncbi:MAG: hypothetical protein JO139_09630, partial [Alphaproteobacteria bacterium]|nr:hypothetical protein [Alphaproteobacteria bacterium]
MGDFAERLQLAPKHGLLAFETVQLDQQTFAVGAGGSRHLLAQARKIAFYDA